MKYIQVESENAMRATDTFAWMTVLLLARGVSAQETMTVERFGEVCTAPGDDASLPPRLASFPQWKDSRVSNTLTYRDGRVFEEECRATTRTVQGRYVVSALESKLYGKKWHSILGFDEKAEAFKLWSLFGEILTEAILVVDLDTGTTAGSSTYGDDVVEIFTTRFSQEESVSRSQVFQKGVLKLTRVSRETPVLGGPVETPPLVTIAKTPARLRFEAYGFSIQPLDGPENGMTFQPLILFLPPTQSFAPNVGVQIQPYKGTMEEYAGLSRRQFVEQKMVLLKDEKLAVDSWVFEYAGGLQGRALHWYARAVRGQDKVYLVTATAAEEQWTGLGQKLKECVNTFRMEAAGPAALADGDAKSGTLVIEGRIEEIHTLGTRDETVLQCDVDPCFVVVVRTGEGETRLAIHSPAKTFSGDPPIGKRCRFRLERSGSRYVLKGVETLAP